MNPIALWVLECSLGTFYGTQSQINALRANLGNGTVVNANWFIPPLPKPAGTWGVHYVPGDPGQITVSGLPGTVLNPSPSELVKPTERDNDQVHRRRIDRDVEKPAAGYRT